MMFRFEQIELSDTRWDTIVHSAQKFDFHQTSCFHKLEIKKDEKAILFCCFMDQAFIAFPLIIRSIPNTENIDASSVYGYGGPISSHAFSDLNIEHILAFKKQFPEHLRALGVLSVFSRLHPLQKYNGFFNDFGEQVALNNTVNIDLSLSPEEQKRAYRKSTKSELNQLRGKKGYSVISSKKPDDILEFSKIYEETMHRVNAKSEYFYPLDYLKSLLLNSCFDSDLLLAVKDGEIAAAAIFTYCSDIVQYHLAGTKEQYKYDTPMKLIIDEARLIANSKDIYSDLHLGGGVGGSDEDSLFKFKSGFSKVFNSFSIWKLILDPKKYEELCITKGIDVKNSVFFPAYRETI